MKHLRFYNSHEEFKPEKSNISKPWISYDKSAVHYNELDYLCFTAEEDSTIGFSINGEFDTLPCIEYSYDEENWQMYDFSKLETLNIESGKSLSFRGNNPNGISKSDTLYINFTMTGKINSSGNLQSLLHKQHNDNENIIPNDYCFKGLFYLCTSLLSAPEVPAIKLKPYCYKSLFNGCTSLTKGPELPAEEMEEACYEYLFKGCSSLTECPKLISTSLAKYCYYGLFYNCTSLESTTELPALDTIYRCYYSMYRGCTKLTNIIGLPATNLAEDCYEYMFLGCSSLVNPPILPATSIGNASYGYMFKDCTSLTTAPELSAIDLDKNSYIYMFSGCTSLKEMPDLPCTNLTNMCYAYMFEKCSALTKAKDLIATKGAYGCYAYMFWNCTGLTETPQILLEEASTDGYDCYAMFRYCYGLKKVTTELKPMTLYDFTYSRMFSDCTSLTQACELPATTLGSNCYNGMFAVCTSLNVAQTILPATQLKESCYRFMYACSNLTTPPLLPATNINVNGCYYLLFIDNNNLRKIKCMATTSLYLNDNTTDWVSHDTLYLSTGGIYIANINTPASALGRSRHGVPANWTIIFMDTTTGKYYTSRDKSQECDEDGNPIT